MTNKKLIILILFFLLASFYFSAAEAEDFSVGLESFYSMEVNPPDSQQGSFTSLLGKTVKFGIVFAALMAVIIITIAGFMYITAGGNTGTIGTAKDMIQKALLGLLIVVGAYLILNTINPDLVNMKFLVTPLEIETTQTTTTNESQPETYQIKQSDEQSCKQKCQPNNYVFNTSTGNCICQGAPPQEEKEQYKTCFCDAKDCYTSEKKCPLFFGAPNCFARQVPKETTCK